MNIVGFAADAYVDFTTAQVAVQTAYAAYAEYLVAEVGTLAEATAADNADAAEDDAYAAHYDDEKETRATATDAFTAAGEALAAVYNAEAAYYSAVADYAQTTADADAAAATTALGAATHAASVSAEADSVLVQATSRLAAATKTAVDAGNAASPLRLGQPPFEVGPLRLDGAGTLSARLCGTQSHDRSEALHSGAAPLTSAVLGGQAVLVRRSRIPP